MTTCKSLYKLIENLQNKINKLEHTKSSKELYSYKIYKIINPHDKIKTINSNKKFISLFFGEKTDEFKDEHSPSIPFITLKNKLTIICYSLEFEIINNLMNNTTNNLTNNIFSILLGIRSHKTNGKIKIINRTKQIIDCKNKNIINGFTIYKANIGDEICLLVESSDIKICEKSIIKIIIM